MDRIGSTIGQEATQWRRYSIRLDKEDVEVSEGRRELENVIWNKMEKVEKVSVGRFHSDALKFLWKLRNKDMNMKYWNLMKTCKNNNLTNWNIKYKSYHLGTVEIKILNKRQNSSLITLK